MGAGATRTYIVTEWLTVAEAAAELSVSPSTVRRYVKEGSLPAFRLRHNGPLRLHPHDVADLLTRTPESEP
jgi:excisionase family DNA binding protein